MKHTSFCRAMVFCGLFAVTGVHATGDSGFLTRDTAPDSLALLLPPAGNSVAFLADKAEYEAARVLKNPQRIALAIRDADYKNFGAAFSEAFGVEIFVTHTPVLFALLQSVLRDSHGYAMRSAKNQYMRVRPFVLYKNATCTPDQDRKMAVTGSYPSGHASFGWTTALVLSEINPSRRTEILRRGLEFGNRRVICGAHWRSDVESGRTMGAVVFTALHANPRFSQSLAQARQELHLQG